MPNAENLIGKGLDSRTTKEQRKIASEGGKASAKARRRKKSMKEAAKMLMDMDIASEKTKATLAKLGIPEDDMSYSMAVMAAMMNEAAKGNVKAAAFIRDTIGDGAGHELQKQRLAIEKQRIEIEAAKAASGENEKEKMQEMLQNVQSIQDLFKNPQPNRDIEDYE